MDYTPNVAILKSLTFIQMLESHSLHSASALRSFQVMKLWNGFPVDLLQFTNVPRCVLTPRQVMSLGRKPESKQKNLNLRIF